MTKIEKAKEFAQKAHDGQFRKGSGKPYIEHPEAVAKILTDMGASEDVICAGWLHDTVEDTDVTLEEVISEFGEHVGQLVAGHSEQKGLDWYEMKIKNMDFLPDSPKDLQMLVLADKIANAKDTYEVFKHRKDGVWDYIGTTVEDQAWYYGQGLKFLYKMGEYEDTKAFYEEFKSMSKKMFKGLLVTDNDLIGFVQTEESQLYDMEHNGWSMCPICKQHKFLHEDVAGVKGRVPCPVCGWKFDERQAVYPDVIGENQLTAKQMRMLYKEFGTTEVHWRKIEEFFQRCERERKMTVQEIAKKQGYEFALLEREGNGIKVYRLISECEICEDGKYKEWVEPVIGIPWYCIVEDGKTQVVSMMSNEYIQAEKKTKRLPLPRGKVAYLKMLYEKYLEYGGGK